MSKRSEAVKKWRKNCKLRIIEAFGGCCAICKYHKCPEALALHHLDPNQKDFSLGKIRSSSIAWDWIVPELRKCILLCHICHTEVHYGYLILSGNEARFNEKFAKYRDDKTCKEPCPVCKNPKLLSQIYCSRQCSGKSKRRVNWNEINLREELKRKSIVRIAEELGCSDGAVHKRLKKMGLK